MKESTTAVAFIVLLGSALSIYAEETRLVMPLDLPDREIVVAYERAAVQNVLAAVNPKVFSGYWSVCADGQGFGHGNTYPSLDGHQMTDALLWLRQVSTVKANWDYVRSFQRPDGLLPLAILPAMAGKKIGVGHAMATVDANGGLYRHWVRGNPLAALAGPTYIQNADIIFRFTQDREWLKAQLPSINLAADYLSSLVSDRGAVKGAGYYVERPTRIESDGVTQCHAVDAFGRVAALNRVVGDDAKAKHYENLADRIQRHFVTRFWVGDHFAEYLHPQRGLIATHGLTDVDWAALALDVATPEQRGMLWPKLKDESRFHYGGMPTGISTRPETYADWEFSHPDRHDLAAMGRVWHLEARARARMGDAEGLLAGLQRVSREGEKHGYYWHERYHPDGKGGCIAAGVGKYCEYAANLIRIVQRFLLGVDVRLDGSVVLAPTVPAAFWERGFGQTLSWRGRSLSYRFERDRVTGAYSGDGAQRVAVRLRRVGTERVVRATIDGRAVETAREGNLTIIDLPATRADTPSRFEVGRAKGRQEDK